MQMTPSRRLPIWLSVLLLAATLLSLPAATASAYMHPTAGRWLQRDPLIQNGPGGGYQDGMGLYEYVRCQPADMRDPRGTSPFATSSDSSGAEGLAKLKALLAALDPIGPLVRVTPAWCQICCFDLRYQFAEPWKCLEIKIDYSFEGTLTRPDLGKVLKNRILRSNEPEQTTETVYLGTARSKIKPGEWNISQAAVGVAETFVMNSVRGLIHDVAGTQECSNCDKKCAPLPICWLSVPVNVTQRLSIPLDNINATLKGDLSIVSVSLRWWTCCKRKAS